LDHTLAPADHLSQRQYHLHRHVSISGHGLELLDSSLRFNLIWFLRGDSPFFSVKKICSSLSRLERRVATIYDLAGIPERKPLTVLFVDSQHETLVLCSCNALLALVMSKM
jgi:hypothetical protein